MWSAPLSTFVKSSVVNVVNGISYLFIIQVYLGFCKIFCARSLRHSSRTAIGKSGLISDIEQLYIITSPFFGSDKNIIGIAIKNAIATTAISIVSRLLVYGIDRHPFLI
jgi:hypothetical protein